MTDDVDTVTTSLVAMTVGETTPDLLEKFVYGLDAARVPEWALRLTDLETLAKKMRETFEVRMLLDGVKEYTDPVTDLRYVFEGAPGRRSCSDPDGLVHELNATGLAPADEIEKAAPMKRVASISTLDALAKKYPKLRRTIRDFTPRGNRGPAHLRLAAEDDDE